MAHPDPVGFPLPGEKDRSPQIRCDSLQRRDGVTAENVDAVVAPVPELARRVDVETDCTVCRRRPPVPDRTGGPPLTGSEKRFSRLRCRQQQIHRMNSMLAFDDGRCREVVIGGAFDHSRAAASAGGDFHRDGRPLGIPGARREVKTDRIRFPVGRNDEPDFLGLAGGNLAERDRRTQRDRRTCRNRRQRRNRRRRLVRYPGRDRRCEFIRQIDPDPVLARHRHGADPDLLAPGGLPRVPAVQVQPAPGRHVLVRRDRQVQLLLPLPRQNGSVGVDHQARGGRSPDHRPRQPRPGRRGVDPPRHDLRPVPARLRIPQDDPFHVVHPGHGRMLSARSLAAISVPVQPQVQIVQDRAGNGVRRGFVPGHHQVETAGALGHLDVLEGELSLLQLGNRTAADPAVRPVPVQDAGARRRLAQPVLRLQRPRPAGVGRGEGLGSVQPRVRPDRTRHQSRTRQRRMFPVLRGRIQQQGGYPCRRG